MQKKRLIAAFTATRYVVRLPPGETVLRIGEPCPALDACLVGRGAMRWVWLTAANPGARRIAEDRNRKRLDELRFILRQAGRECIEATAIADAGDWPPETGFLVPGIDLAEAKSLAVRFGQVAILAGVVGDAVRLHWVGYLDAPPATFE